MYCQSVIMETPWSNPWVLQKGQWLTYLDKKDTYCHIGIHPADRCYLHFCHNGTAWQFTVLSFGLSTSLRVFTKTTQTSTSLFPFAWGQATYGSGRLIVKPRVTSKHPGAGLCSRANILANVPLQKARVGCKLIYIYQMYANYLKLDTVAGLATSSDKMVTNLLSFCFLLYVIHTMKWLLLNAIRSLNLVVV